MTDRDPRDVAADETELDDWIPPRIIELALLKEHPRNYNEHPEDQVNELAASVRQNGFYKNIVAARDLTILAGHGLRRGAMKAGRTRGPVRVLDLDPNDPQALKILAADNTLSHSAAPDDRLLTELLKEIKETSQEGLVGTGYDDNKLAALLMVTRPASEIGSFDAAAEWVGMPEYEDGQRLPCIVIQFDDIQKREQFATEYNIQIKKREAKAWSTKWPWEDNLDSKSVSFEVPAPETAVTEGGEDAA